MSLKNFILESLDYNIVLSNNSEKDQQEVILLQEKGVHDFIGSSYTFSFEKKSLKIETVDKIIILKEFPSQLLYLLSKEEARLVILEINDQFSSSLRGNVFFPDYEREKRIKTGGRKKKELNQ